MKWVVFKVILKNEFQIEADTDANRNQKHAAKSLDYEKYKMTENGKKISIFI